MAAYSLDSQMKPVMHVSLNEKFSLKTVNAFGSEINNEEELNQLIATGKHHPLSGPIYIKGVRSGDCIEVNILDIIPNKIGYQCLSRSSGFIKCNPFSRKFCKISFENGQIEYNGLVLQAKPSIGAVGTASKEKTRSGRTGKNGGNLDLHEISVNSKLILPCDYDGGLLYFGDMHLLQNNGEVSGIAAETGGSIVASVNISEYRFDFPVLYTDEDVIIIGYGNNIEEALKTATCNACCYISRQYLIEYMDAYMLLGIIGSVVLGHATGAVVSCGIKIFNEHLLRLKEKKIGTI